MIGTTLTKREIAQHLKALGVQPAMTLMVHSSLSALGQVEGGADAVIDALLEVIGPQGTLLMPTHPARDGRTFDPDAIPSDMGTISETFRQRRDVRRSRHPYHPVAALGADAARLLHQHESSAAPDGSATPYGRLIAAQGFALLIGCDLDTLTLLHAIEANLDLPYLRELEMQYVDANGKVRHLAITRCPGGHRGGVLKFDRLLRAEGALVSGQIGNAVCRLIDASRAAEIMTRELSTDPCFALDENPHCADCVRFRERVAASGMRPSAGSYSTAKTALEDILAENFTLTVALVSATDFAPQLETIASAGLHCVELPLQLLRMQEIRTSGLSIALARTTWEELRATPDWVNCMLEAQCSYLRVTPPERGADRETFIVEMGTIVRECAAPGITVLLANAAHSIAPTADALAYLIETVNSGVLGASYDPAALAHQGGSPFYGELYKGPLRKHVQHVDFLDVLGGSGEQVAPGYGNSELVEILSNLRCRSYRGLICLWPLPTPQGGLEVALERFQTIMGSI